MKPLPVVLILLFLFALLPAGASASKEQEAMIQDDNHFIYTTPAKQRKALAEAAALGADRVRVTILWRGIAPKPLSRTKPKGFDASKPSSYPPAVWEKYDRLVE